MVATSSGPVQGILHIEVSHPDHSRHEVRVEGLSTQTGFFFGPPSLDFGALPQACPQATRSIRLWRHNEAPTALTGLRVEGEGLSLVAGPDLSGAPLVVPAGEHEVVLVGFDASSTKSAVGALVIDAEVDGTPTRQRVPLIGRRLDAPRIEERFVQVDRQMVDVLFAIDYTGCQHQERDGLKPHFDALMRVARVAQLNYQLGFTTSDLPREGGRLVHPDAGPYGDAFGERPEDKIITASSPPDPQTLFGRGLQARPESGGGREDESGIGAMYLALQASLLSGHNAGLVRRRAHLGLFWMSDEADQTRRSPWTPTDDLDFYLDYFRAMKGVDAESAVTFVGFGGDPPSGCDGPGGFAGAAPRPAELASRTGGVFESICTADYAATASGFSGPLVGERTAFFLRQAPVASSLEVLVDGSPAARALWTYRPSDRSIRFEGPGLPEPGAELVVRYLPACL